MSDLVSFVQPLKDACDRDWKDETPEQIVIIAANALHWRKKGREAFQELLDAAENVLMELGNCFNAGDIIAASNPALTALRAAIRKAKDCP